MCQLLEHQSIEVKSWKKSTEIQNFESLIEFNWMTKHLFTDFLANYYVSKSSPIVITQRYFIFELAELPGVARADFENFSIVVSFCHIKIWKLK